MQKLITLIIMFAIVYTIISIKMENNKSTQVTNSTNTINNSLSSNESPDNQVITGNFFERTLSNMLINVLKTEDGRLFFENILKPVNSPIAGIEGFKVNNSDLVKSMFKFNDIGEGQMGPASCGHTVKISYTIMDMQHNALVEDTKIFTLGSVPDIPALDSIVVGMKVGQIRNALIPAKYAYYNDKYKKQGIENDQNYKISVTLLEILPQNFALPEEVKIFDDEIAYKIPLLCGNNVRFNAKIIKLSNGEVIYDSSKNEQKLNMKIGDINYPMIFSHALYGKIPTGMRTVIARGKNYKSLGLGTSVIFPKEQLPADEFFMLELNDFDVIE